MSSALLWLLGGLFLVAMLLLLPEAFCFFNRRQSLGRLDRHEWTRTLAAIRNHGGED